MRGEHQHRLRVSRRARTVSTHDTGSISTPPWWIAWKSPLSPDHLHPIVPPESSAGCHTRVHVKAGAAARISSMFMSAPLPPPGLSGVIPWYQITSGFFLFEKAGTHKTEAAMATTSARVFLLAAAGLAV